MRDSEMAAARSKAANAKAAELSERVAALHAQRAGGASNPEMVAVVARAEAAEVKAAALDARWTALREHIATARDEQDGAAERGSCREAAAAADALDGVLKHMDEAAARGCGVA